MKKTKNSVMLSALLSIILSAFILESCKTIPILKGIEKPFGIIGENADIYVYIPIEQNRNIVEQALPLAAGKDMKQVLGRTSAVYSGVFFNSGLSEVRVCAVGKYPYGMTDLFFKKKNGWEPRKTKDGYKYYESPYVDISIPSPLLACVGLGPETRKHMDELLERMKNPTEPKFPEQFRSLISSGSQDIGIFVTNSEFFLSGLLGVRLGLPLGKIEMYLQKDLTAAPQSKYIYNLYVEAENPLAAKVAKTVLQKMLSTEVRVKENILIIENGNIPESKIITIVKSVYPH